jgi:hypothetical protein
VIVGRQQVNGRWEYLLLTNEHVAHNYHIEGESKLRIIEGNGVHAPIRLAVIAFDEKWDQALLRTIASNVAFSVPDYVIGPPPKGEFPAIAFTEGYGDGKFSTRECDIVSTRTKRWGIRSYEIDVRVGGGQSGSPLVIVGRDSRLYLPALVFCGNEHHTEATPLFPRTGVLQDRQELQVTRQTAATAK